MAHDLGTAGEQEAQGKRKAQHPLAHRGLGQNLIDQQRRAFGHAPGPATGAEAPVLAAEGDQVFGVAGLTAQTQETVFEATAFEVVFELALDILRKVSAARGHLIGERGVVLVD